jgi:hypothetical protein
MKIDKINDEFIVDCTNNSKEERQQVYKFLVDNRNYEKSYLEEDYPVIVCNKKQNYSNWDSLENYYNWVDSKKDIPIYTFEKFEEMYLKEEFILPVKWCIKDCKKVTEYGAKRFHHKMGDIWEDAYLCIDESSGKYNYLKKKYNYTEITFEQFKKYVLKNNNIENNKQIIGYKLIKPEYKEAAENIVALGVNWKVGKSFIEVMENNPDDYYTKKLKEAGVLELWFEKVYGEEFKIGDWIISTNDIKSIVFKIESINEEYYECENDNFGIVALRKDKEDLRLATTEEIAKAQKTIVKMYSSNKGEFEIEVIDGKAYYIPENKHLPKEWIRDIIDNFGEIIMSKGGIDYPYNVKVSSLNVGCMQNCRKEDFQKVYDLLK